MKFEPVVKAKRPWLSAAIVLVSCAGAFVYFMQLPTIPDIAWLIEASRRWRGGAVLYRDVIEVNPPLIFYETAALTGGTLTQIGYKAGVCFIIACSGLWSLRLRGTSIALSALAAMLLGGLTDFGQRDHLALIFVIPLLLGEPARRNERTALGLWAFLGVGLKPYFILIPLAALAARSLQRRSLRPFVSAEAVSLWSACAAFGLYTEAVHPAYLAEIVPLGRQLYWVYGVPAVPTFTLLTAVLALVIILSVVLRERLAIQVAAACVGAIASFYLQGRNYSYHFVPAIGLGILLTLLLPRRFGVLLCGLLASIQLTRGPGGSPPAAPIPSGVHSVAILSAHVFAAYPEVLNRGIVNSTRYPALWTLPGAWRMHHTRELAAQRAIIRGDILRARPDMIIADARPWKPYFNGPFDYVAFLGPFPDYAFERRVRIGVFVYDQYRRNRQRIMN